jgi:inner membrane protein
MVPAGTAAAAVWGVMIGSELPDIDFVVRYFGGEVKYLRHHRGPTHGLAMLPLKAAVVAAALGVFWPGASFGLVWLWTLLGCLSHVFFDCGNDYGTQAFWPLSGRRVAMDIIPIVDLWVLGAIGAGWMVHWAWAGHRQAVFAAVWAVLALYVGYRLWLRARAFRLVAAQFDLSQPLGEAPCCGPGWRHRNARLTVHPTLLSLTAWHYIIQMPGEFLLGMVWVPAIAEGRVGKPQRATNAMDQTVLASLKSQVVSLFADWVRLPRVSVEKQNGLTCVRWTDMRYETDDFSPFTAYAWLDENLTLVNEGLGTQKPPLQDRTVLKRRLRKEMGIEES